jgi:hypothetical protein
MASIAKRIPFPNGPINLKGFDLPEAKDGIPQLHIIGAFIGQSGSGKTTACVNMVSRMESQGLYDVITLISPTGVKDEETKIRPEPKWGLIDFTETYKDYTPKVLNQIIKAQKQRIIAYREYLELLKLWKMSQSDDGQKKLKAWQWLFLDEQTQMEKPENPNPSGKERYPTQLILLDDCGQLSQHDKLMNDFVSKSRHNNASIICCVQYLCQLPRVLRKQLNMIAVFKNADVGYLTEIFKEFCAADMIPEVFHAIMSSLPTRKDFLFIDLKEVGDNRFRINFDCYLHIPEPEIDHTLNISTDDKSHQKGKRRTHTPEEDEGGKTSKDKAASDSRPPGQLNRTDPRCGEDERANPRGVRIVPKGLRKSTS